MQEKTFWLDTVEIPVAVTRELPQRVDVAIIGAGFTGLSAARSLAKSGATVAVSTHKPSLGRQFPQWRHGPHRTKTPAATLIDRYGKEVTARMYAASLESIDFVEQLVREEVSPAISRAAATSKWLAKQNISTISAAPPTKPRAILIINSASSPKTNSNPKLAPLFITADWLTLLAPA